jgi:hypothetical protein
MARELRWWIAGPMLVCAGLAIVYLPPRGAAWPREPRVDREAPNPYRLRERDLAHRLRDDETALRLLEYRERLRPELDRRRMEGIPGPTALVIGDSLPEAVRHQIARKLDTVWDHVWRHLGLGVTKVSVGVVLEASPGQQPTRWIAYLLPDSSDRTTCVALLPATYSPRSLLTDSLANALQVPDWLGIGLGPCAFYAAFGNPGRGVARWLSARRYDLALDSDWSDTTVTPSVPWWLSPNLNPEAFWEVTHRLPPNGLGCLAGRVASCRAAVLGNAQATDSVRRFLANDRWQRRPTLFGDDHYLADVRRAIGPERFRDFWNSELPVDTALTAALRMPIGEWTRRWEARAAPVVRLGPSAPPQSVLLALLLGLAAIGWVVRSVGRREVR